MSTYNTKQGLRFEKGKPKIIVHVSFSDVICKTAKIPIPIPRKSTRNTEGETGSNTKGFKILKGNDKACMGWEGLKNGERKTRVKDIFCSTFH